MMPILRIALFLSFCIASDAFTITDAESLYHLDSSTQVFNYVSVAHQHSDLNLMVKYLQLEELQLTKFHDRLQQFS